MPWLLRLAFWVLVGPELWQGPAGWRLGFFSLPCFKSWQCQGRSPALTSSNLSHSKKCPESLVLGRSAAERLLHYLQLTSALNKWTKPNGHVSSSIMWQQSACMFWSIWGLEKNNSNTLGNQPVQNCVLSQCLWWYYNCLHPNN